MGLAHSRGLGFIIKPKTQKQKPIKCTNMVFSPKTKRVIHIDIVAQLVVKVIRPH